MVCIFLCVVMITMISQSDEHMMRSRHSVYPEHRETRRIETLVNHPSQGYAAIGSSSKKHSSHVMIEKSVPSNGRITFIDDERQSGTYKDSLGRYMNISSSNPKPLVTTRKGKRQVSNDAPLVFPGPTKPRPAEVSDLSLSDKSGSSQPVIPEHCKKLGYCEKVLNYPKKASAAILARLGEAAKYLANDELAEETAIAQRQGAAEENRELCPSDERITTPESLPDRFGKWYYILKNQRVRVEICDTVSSPCRQNIVMFQDGYSGSCVQKFSYRSLLAIDENNNLVYNNSFKIPSCCSCVGTVL